MQKALLSPSRLSAKLLFSRQTSTHCHQKRQQDHSPLPPPRRGHISSSNFLSTPPLTSAKPARPMNCAASSPRAQQRSQPPPSTPFTAITHSPEAIGTSAATMRQTAGRAPKAKVSSPCEAAAEASLQLSLYPSPPLTTVAATTPTLAKHPLSSSGSTNSRREEETDAQSERGEWGGAAAARWSRDLTSLHRRPLAQNRGGAVATELVWWSPSVLTSCNNNSEGTSTAIAAEVVALARG